jgi:hypothetical protein
MPEKARGAVVGAASTVLVAVVSGVAAVDQALLRSRRTWWGRWLP